MQHDESRGAFYDTGRAQEALVVRPRNIYDNVLPSGSSSAAFALVHLARLTDNREYERLAAAAIRSVEELMVRYPSGFGHWLCALDFYLSRPKEIVVVGQPGDPAMRSLVSVVNLRYLPNKVLAGWNPDESAQPIDIPLLQDRVMIENRPTAYVCESHVCLTPVTEPDALASQLDQA